MIKQIFVGALGCAMLLNSSTWAATLQSGQGDLSINQGHGFQPVDGRIDAEVGDSVMIGPGGTATLVYGDGCEVDVQPGTVTTIAPLSPCASGSYAAELPIITKAPPPQPTETGFNWGVVVVGAAAAAAVGAGIFELTQGPSPGPVSP